MEPRAFFIRNDQGVTWAKAPAGKEVGFSDAFRIYVQNSQSIWRAFLEWAGCFELALQLEVEMGRYRQIWCMTIRQRSCQIDHPLALHPETERYSRPVSVGRTP